MHLSQKESYRLDAVALEEVGEQKVRYTGTISDLWRKQPALLVEYNFKDVELCVEINRKDNIIEFYREIARYVGCPLDKTLNSSSVVDVYVLRKAFGKYVLPSKGFANAEEFEGATVFEPSRGIRENVVVLDLKSLYPMAMMTINASPETKDPNGELKAPNGIRFRKQPDGLTRTIISELLKERDEKKALRNTFAFGSPQYILYDMQQNVLKVIMNTYYGVSGYPRFRLFDREIGSAATSVGRAIIEHTRRVIEQQGYKVIYGDTDSCMVQLARTLDREQTIATARAIESDPQRELPGLCEERARMPMSISSPSSSRRSMPGSSRRGRRNGTRARSSGKKARMSKRPTSSASRSGAAIRRRSRRSSRQKVMEQILAGDRVRGDQDIPLGCH